MSAPWKTCWSARSPRRSAAARGAAPALAALLLGPWLAGGCISLSAHNRKVEELRSELAAAQQEAQDKDRSIDAMEEERQKLSDEIEELRAVRTHLQNDVKDRDEKMVKLRGTYDALVQDLEGEVAAGELHIERLTEGMVFRLPQDVLFPAGSAELTVEGRKDVRDLAERIKTGSDRVEVQGHSDDRAIKGALTGRYPTNWELAGARAASVVRVLEESGVAPGRLSAVSFGSTRPLVSNETPEGRAQNRRIEVRLIPVRTPAPGEGQGEAEAGGAPATTAPEGAPPGGSAPEAAQPAGAERTTGAPEAQAPTRE